MRKLAALLLLGLAAHSAFAQVVIQADSATLQPQINRDKDGFSACGVRAIVVSGSSDFMDAYDFSLMIYADLFAGTLKAGKIRTPVGAALAGKFSKDAVVPPPIKFWVALESEGKAISPLKTSPSDSKGYILGVSDLVETMRGIMALIHGERMQFAVRYKDQPVDIVVSFSAQMPDLERGPLMKCMDAVTNRLSKSAGGSRQ